MNSIVTAGVGSVVYVKRWAAQCHASTYYYLRACEVIVNRRGKYGLRALESRAYGCRGNGSLRLPSLVPFRLPDTKPGYRMGDFWPERSSVKPHVSEDERQEVYSNDDH